MLFDVRLEGRAVSLPDDFGGDARANGSSRRGGNSVSLSLKDGGSIALLGRELREVTSSSTIDNEDNGSLSPAALLEGRLRPEDEEIGRWKSSGGIRGSTIELLFENCAEAAIFAAEDKAIRPRVSSAIEAGVIE